MLRLPIAQATITPTTRCDLSPDSFVMMLRYCANFKAVRYESMSLNRIVANKLHRVIVASVDKSVVSRWTRVGGSRLVWDTSSLNPIFAGFRRLSG